MADLFIEGGWVLLFARIALGVSLIYYGRQKIKDLKSNANDFVGMGFKPGWFWGTIVAFVEFFGGIAMLLGFFAEIVAALYGFQMLIGTIWKRKIKKPFTDYSYDIQLLALCLVVVAFGPGVYALVAFGPLSLLLSWDIAVVAVLLAIILAYLPELLGERYRKWGTEATETAET